MKLHWIKDNDWYRLDLKTGEWSLYAIKNGFDLVSPRWGVVPGTSELRAWDDGVGRVVRIDPTGNPTRIDRSFYQKNQFGHVSHIEQNGTIHAIGGVGLYHPKNFGISFSESSNGWHRTSGDESISEDPYVSFGYSLRDPLAPTLILISAYGIADHPRTPGILSMDLETGVIRLLHADMEIALERGFRGGPSWLQSSVGDGSHRLAFFLIAPATPENQRTSRILVMDLDTRRIIEIESANEGDTDPGTHHTVLHYNEADSTLYSVQWTHHTIEMVNFVSVSKAKVDVRALKSMLANGKSPEEPRTQTTHHPVWPWQLAFMITLIGLFLVWIRTKRQTSIHTPSSPSDKLLICPDPLLLNGRTWEDLFDGNYPLEAQLLTLLAKAAENGTPIVSSDTIDRVLIPNHPSPDFIRKIRNQTRKRLEESLQDIHPTTNSKPYILIDRDVLDKRKTKLQLNLTVVDLSPPR
jgi:hypothetical protein